MGKDSHRAGTAEPEEKQADVGAQGLNSEGGKGKPICLLRNVCSSKLLGVEDLKSMGSLHSTKKSDRVAAKG